MKRTLQILLLALSLSFSGMTATADVAKREQTAAADAPTLSVAQSSFTVKGSPDCNLTFEVYSLTGQLVKKFRLEDGSFTLELPRGCYIVKCSCWSKKVVIKG